MTPAGYIISVTTDSNNRGFIPSVRNVLDSRQMLMASGGEEKTVYLFIVSADNINAKKLKKQLQAVPGLKKVLFASFDIPIKATGSGAVRDIFIHVDYDLSNITDDQLTILLESKLKGQFTYTLASDHKRNEKGLFNARIRLTQDIIDEHKDDPPPKIISRKRTTNDTEEIIVEIVMKEIEMHSPPPPPS